MLTDARDFSEQSRVVLVEYGENPLHYGLTEHSRLALHLELLAVFVYSGQLSVIQIDDVSVRTSERGLLFL